jgi:phospholipid-binding lipoprotein MlaA
VTHREDGGEPPRTKASPRRRRDGLMLLSVLLAVAVAPSSSPAQAPVAQDPLYDEATDVPLAGFPDPLERMNRLTFRLNGHLGRWLIDPLVRAYDFAIPAPGRRAIRRALLNLDSPAVFVNDVLQCQPVDAAVIFTRFAFNSTVGIAGLLDPATRVGLPGHQSDFGQTLALVGVPSGPYLILPVVGPTTARDGTGYLVDFLFRPTTYLLTPGTQVVITSVTEGGAGIAMLDANATALRALEASAVDYYTALKSAFYQDRMARIWARREGGHPIVAAARRVLHGLSLARARSEVRDLPAHGGEQPLEAVALER